MGVAMWDEFVYGVGKVENYYTFYPYIVSNTPVILGVELTPPYLIFPSAGGTATLTVTNSGTGNLNFTSTPAIIGYNAPDFAVVAGNTTCVSGTTIGPGQSCVIDVMFSPSTESWEVATLSLFDNASYGPQTVPLSGAGQLASIAPNPVPGSGSPQTVTITGTKFEDGATINWQDLTLSPPGYLWTGTINNAQVISPTTMTVDMTVEDASAIWQIEVVNPGVYKPTDLGKTSNWYPFQVTGVGSATPSYLDDYPYKNAQFDPSSSKTCSKVNGQSTNDKYGFCYRECTSYVAWRMNRDAATPDTTNPSFFNSMAGGLWGDASNWAANASPNSLGYMLDPTPQVGDIAQWGALDHVAYVENVDPDGSVDVSEYNYGYDDGGKNPIKHQYGVRHLSLALGNLPDEYIHISRLSLSPTNLDFGSQAAGTSNYLPVTVTNSLAQTISLENISVGASEAGSAGAADFGENDTCGGSLPAGGQCQITVTFAPPAMLGSGGSQSATLILNWGKGPQLIPVKGLALTNLTPSPRSLSFGSVPVGTSASKVVTLMNNTGADVNISSAAITGSPAFEQTATTCGATLKWQSHCTITLSFSPTAKGKDSGALTITDDAINSPQTVTLKGSGT
jgi:surface antigen